MDGAIYMGTSLITRGRADERGKDVLARYESYEGGHIYRFDPAAELASHQRMQTPDPSRALPFVYDLGVAVPGEGIVCLVLGKSEFYGVTFPSGRFRGCRRRGYYPSGRFLRGDQTGVSCCHPPP
jgi:hypothetical protein